MLARSAACLGICEISVAALQGWPKTGQPTQGCPASVTPREVDAWSTFALPQMDVPRLSCIFDQFYGLAGKHVGGSPLRASWRGNLSVKLAMRG
jgi:hypothetical protein